MKKFLKFIIILSPWFLSSLLFKSDNIFYKSLEKPFFAPTPIIFPIVWTILYTLIAISIYKIYSNFDYKKTKSYTKSLIINYFFNQTFTFFFFTLKSPFLGFIDAILVFISSLFLYYETNELNKSASKYLIPYIIWNLFAVILSTSIFFMNL